MFKGRRAGIGVGMYTSDAHRQLDHAVPDVEGLARLLGATFDGEPLRNPTEGQARDYLRSLRGTLPADSALVVAWSGHGSVPASGGLRLLGSDSGPYASDGIPSSASSSPARSPARTSSCSSSTPVSPATRSRRTRTHPQAHHHPKTGSLVKTTEHAGIPELDQKQAADAMLFHTDLRAAEEARPASLTTTHTILGTQQNTPTTARVQNGALTLRPTYTANHLYGDGTVPLVAACRADVPMNSNTLRRIPDQHGNLQRNPAALDELEDILTASDIVVRAPEETHLRLDVPELITADEDLAVRLTSVDGAKTAVRLTLTDEAGNLEQASVVLAGPKPIDALFDGLPPGAYTVDATGTNPGSRVAAVSADTLVWA